jgi:two-component system response regulator MprA
VDLCRRLRSEGGRVPILMLTARDTVNDRIAGLDAGADDYLVKPFGTAELVARVRALMRRSRIEPEDATLRFADLTLDPITREVRRDGRAVELTRREFDLLAAFLTRPGAVLDREQLLVDAWGFESPVETNAVDVYVGYLRKKLEADGESRLLWTVRGVGYVLQEDRT